MKTLLELSYKRYATELAECLTVFGAFNLTVLYIGDGDGKKLSSHFWNMFHDEQAL